MLTRIHPSRYVLVAACWGALASVPAWCDEGPVSKAASEAALIETLRTGEPAQKALACKQLAIYGGPDCVPKLVPLLADERLLSWARIALEAIPHPAADEALRQAAAGLDGKRLIGVIHSIGARRDAGAVEPLLTALLNGPDGEAASAAAVAIGQIGNLSAAAALSASLNSSTGPLRGAVAEGCILCAEHLMHDGKTDGARALYDAVRAADVPKPRILEATRGAILVRQTAGIPLLIETLQAKDQDLSRLGLSAARELPGREVAEALGAQFAKAPPELAALLLYALADRQDSVVTPGILTAARQGERPVRLAAIRVLGRSNTTDSLSALLDLAADPDNEIGLAGKTAVGALKGEHVNAEIAARLRQADGPALLALLELAGQRRVHATDDLVKATAHADAAIRKAALAALGQTVAAEELSILISAAVAPPHADDAEDAIRALRAACVRMPDREACAAELTAAVGRANMATQARLVEIFGELQGTTALGTIAKLMKQTASPDSVQDAGSRVLGAWMTVEAAPLLLDLAQSANADKYQVRALRSYIRLSRQFAMPDPQRAEMCAHALRAARRDDERKLVLAVLERYPSLQTLKIAVDAASTATIKDDASLAAMRIALRTGTQTEQARQLLGKVGIVPRPIEILKAEYGADTQRREVTAIMQQHARDLPLIVLPSPYNTALGGDPAPETEKYLSIRYRLDGKEGEARFAENATILLPVPE